MFDIGFSELLVIGVVALIVIGPERLPKVARAAGHLLGRFQRYAASVKADISREMELDELRRAGQTFKESVESAARGVEREASAVDEHLKAEVGHVEKVLAALNTSVDVAALPDPAHGQREPEETPPATPPGTPAAVVEHATPQDKPTGPGAA
jgi:sec-independent protein translocase protein TatB